MFGIVPPSQIHDAVNMHAAESRGISFLSILHRPSMDFAVECANPLLIDNRSKAPNLDNFFMHNGPGRCVVSSKVGRFLLMSMC